LDGFGAFGALEKEILDLLEKKEEETENSQPNRWILYYS
jgi:hypothetical protein